MNKKTSPSPRQLAKATAEAEKAYWAYIACRARLQDLVNETNDELALANKVLDRRVAPIL